MPINLKNLTTTADHADVFTVASAGGVLVNLGKLSASGLLADGIRVTANNVSVQNLGSITVSGDGADGIGAGDWLAPVNGVNILNLGLIHVSGNGYFDSDLPQFPSAIDVIGDHARVTNIGRIESVGFDASGVELVGSDAQITNMGTIDATDIGIIVDTINGGEHGNTITNLGLIVTHDSELAHGIWLLQGGNTVINSGTIRAEGFHDFGIAIESVGNQAFNYGTIQATGEQARGVLIDHDGNTFTNYGRIDASGLDSIGVRFGFEDGFSLTGSSFTNYGTVKAPGSYAVLGSIPDEQVVNRGTLIGDVDMSEGNDRYVAGNGGHLIGILTLGEGDDTLVFERHGGRLTVSDFATGAGSDDRIDLSAFHLHGFGDVMSHASQSGADVLINLGGGDQILLQSTSLASLNAADFILG